MVSLLGLDDAAIMIWAGYHMEYKAITSVSQLKGSTDYVAVKKKNLGTRTDVM